MMTWKLYWRDSDGRFCAVPDFDAAPTVGALIEDDDANRTGAFWG